VQCSLDKRFIQFCFLPVLKPNSFRNQENECIYNRDQLRLSPVKYLFGFLTSFPYVQFINLQYARYTASDAVREWKLIDPARTFPRGGEAARKFTNKLIFNPSNTILLIVPRHSSYENILK
jgi:hypothetical protein